MKCQTCNGPLSGRQKMFCCVSCRNSANGKTTGGWNRSRVSVICQNCGGPFEVPPYRVPTARACSRACLAAIQSRERKGTFGMGAANPMYTTGIETYRRHRKNACERCGSDRFLVVHHRDENRHNNVPENLETLCKRCHQLHHDCTANLPQYR